MLPHLHSRLAGPQRRHPRRANYPAPCRGAAGRRRPLSRRRRRQRHRRLLGHRQRTRRRARLLAGRRLRLRRQRGLRPQEDGHHRPRRVGVRAAALPGDGHGYPKRRVHRRRHRRYGRRCVRQRDAAIAMHPLDGGVQPPAHLHRPGPGCSSEFQGTRAAVPARARRLGALRCRLDLPRRRRVQPRRQGHPRHFGNARALRHRSNAANSRRTHQRLAARAGGFAVERRHRHLY